jgi:hypothetical protein
VRILEYVGLDTSRVKAQYAKVCAAIERDDFRQADVKKLSGATHGTFYRARLDYANRLLFTIVRHGGAAKTRTRRERRRNADRGAAGSNGDHPGGGAGGH